MGIVLGYVAGYKVGETARALQSYMTSLCRQISDVVAINGRVGLMLRSVFVVSLNRVNIGMKHTRCSLSRRRNDRRGIQHQCPYAESLPLVI
jgi:hypothetical protein